jgi:hypothetical protein
VTVGRVFGRSFVFALPLPSALRRAVVGHRLRRRTPSVAGPEEIDARLDALFDHLLELTAPGREHAGLDEAVAHACARVAEWRA